MSSHYNNFTVEERTRKEQILSMNPIPRVKSAKEAEARTKEMSKTYLKKEEVKKKTLLKKLEEKKGVSQKTLINGSKEKGIKRMSINEAANMAPNGYNKRRPYQYTSYNKSNQEAEK